MLEDSFYARMGAVNDVLFKDNDLAGMYCDNNGQPSVPPSLMSGILLLQFYDDVSDEEAIARLNFDLRWKVALNLPLDFPPNSSSLSVFRSRLVKHGQERNAFSRLIRVGREAGFLPDKITIWVDSMGPTRCGSSARHLHPDLQGHPARVEGHGLSSACQKARPVASADATIVPPPFRN